MRRLFPEPAGPITPDELAAGRRQRVGARPWVGICMISSLDGSTAVGERSRGLSSAADTAVLAALRRVADVIVVGAATVRVEGYGPPATTGQRIGVVTTTGDVDPTSRLFASGAGFLIMPEDGARAPHTPTGPVDTIRAGHGRVDLAVALSRLDELMAPPTFVHAEGGPRLNASLFEAGCVDELNLTVSPTVVGGAGARITHGAPEQVRGFELDQLAAADSFLFGRWRRRPESGSATSAGAGPEAGTKAG
jgi:riboflavin biosynthesis pyrimidine reductase